MHGVGRRPVARIAGPRCGIEFTRHAEHRFVTAPGHHIDRSLDDDLADRLERLSFLDMVLNPFSGRVLLAARHEWAEDVHRARSFLIKFDVA